MRVREAAGADLDSVVSTFARAFNRDPFNQWIFPDPTTREARLTELFSSLTIRSVAHGAIVEVTEDVEAAALWDPPGTAVSEEGATEFRPEVVNAFPLSV
jgi:hypothetical protein